MRRTVREIEKEMTLLYPKKELAFIDYHDNMGDKELSSRLYDEFDRLRIQWNKLVAERKEAQRKARSV